MNQEQIRLMVRGVYDVQKLRIMMGNRLVGNWKVKAGQHPGEPEEEITEDGKVILAKLRASHNRLADAITSRTRTMIGDGVIDSLTEFELVDAYVRTCDAEEQILRAIRREVHGQPIWIAFLEEVKGCGELMSAVILSEIDIHKARHRSSLYRYAGLDVGPDGRGRSRRADHLVDATYTDKAGDEQTRKSITFNPFLKTKLVGVLGSSFLKCSSPYRAWYDQERHRCESMTEPDGKPMGKLHAHNRATRKMVKAFLDDLYVAWRTLEGLPVSASYAETHLGIVHGQ